MTHRHTIARQLFLFMRDALGRFTRLRVALAPKAPARRLSRLATLGVQLPLF